MPYENERSSYEPLRRIAESERVKELLGNYRVRQRPMLRTAALPLIDVSKLPHDGWKPHWVLAIDGSFHVPTFAAAPLQVDREARGQTAESLEPHLVDTHVRPTSFLGQSDSQTARPMPLIVCSTQW